MHILISLSSSLNSLQITKNKVNTNLSPKQPLQIPSKSKTPDAKPTIPWSQRNKNKTPVATDPNNNTTDMNNNNDKNTQNNKQTSPSKTKTKPPLKTEKPVDLDDSDVIKEIFGETEDEVFGSLTEEELRELAGI